MRPLILLIVMALCAAGVGARLAFWQVLQHDRLAAAELSEQSLGVQQPLRGQIVDAHGNPLATDVSRHVAYANPRLILNPYRVATLLAPIVHKDASRLEALLASNAVYVPLAHNLDATTTTQVQRLKLKGIGLDPEVQRTYPEGRVASQIVGFVRSDGTAQYGLEQRYDSLLTGKAQLGNVLTDTTRNDVRLSAQSTLASQKGADLHLALDGVVQGLVEDELHKAVKLHGATGGTIIVMDPRTGYILGMANEPSYDPNHYATVKDPTRFMNQAISWTYEPGSTFKVITMAAGLDSHVVTPESTFDDTGQFVVGDTTLHNWNMAGFGMENMTQVLQHSANVGAAWVAQQLGTNLFYKYVNRFQFGRPTHVDLQGEGQGLLPLPGDKNWSIVNLYTNAFGQGLSTTPLQMIRAVGAVANNGVMMRPQLVKEIVYRGRVIQHPPISDGQVISPQTAHTLTDMLVKSAIGGEAALGLVKGYDIAAKTGTANIAGPDGRYIKNATIASIVGYAPAYNPRFVVLVIIERPQDTPWGSMAAAPVLHDLFQELFMYAHIPPSPNAAFQGTPVPTQ